MNDRKIVFLHVPHTGGRMIGRFMWSHNLNYVKLHNNNDISLYLDDDNDYKNGIEKYFVVRDPIERAYKEFLHYSRNLDRIGMVNHLSISDFTNLDHNNPYDYLGMEVNKNVYCKFLLMREDFSVPVTDQEFNKMDLDDFKYDLFEDIPTLPTLSGLINMNIDVPKLTKTDVEIPQNVKTFIEKNNEYDIMLFKNVF